MTEDGAFRVITVGATETVREAVAVQRIGGRTTRLFGDLLIAAVLVRETMAPSFKVQISLKGSSGQGMVADSYPEGTSRGLTVGVADGADIDFGGEALLMVSRIMPRTGLHQSIVRLTDDSNLAIALTAYLHESEQVDSMVAIATVEEGDRIVAAGGYIVQKLPEADREHLVVMNHRLRELPPFDDHVRAAGSDPLALADDILEGMPYRRLEESEQRFGCHCTFARVLDSLTCLGADEIERTVESGEVLDITCDYCGSNYQVGPTALQSLLDREV